MGENDPSAMPSFRRLGALRGQPSGDFARARDDSGQGREQLACEQARRDAVQGQSAGRARTHRHI